MTVKPSFYNFVVTSKQTDRCFIFNARTQAIVELPNTIAQAVCRGECRGLPSLLARHLSHQGILVEDGSDEQAAAVSDVVKRRTHKDVRLVLIPTYRCNQRCPYCYEGEVTRSGTPDLGGWADEVIAFLEDLRMEGVPGATIGFFGGEPLLAAESCLAVARGASSVSRQRQKLFYCTLTNNGSILNASVEQLLGHVHSVQVTLDGIGREHDRWRCYSKGQGTYSSILDFIAASEAAGVEKTTIRFHLHDYTEAYVRKCAAELHERVGTLRGVQIYFVGIKHGCYRQGMMCAHDEVWSKDIEKSIRKSQTEFPGRRMGAKSYQ